MRGQKFRNLQEPNRIFTIKDGLKFGITDDFPFVLRILQPKTSTNYPMQNHTTFPPTEAQLHVPISDIQQD